MSADALSTPKAARRRTLDTLRHQMGHAVESGMHRLRHDRHRRPYIHMEPTLNDWEELTEPDESSSPTSSTATLTAASSSTCVSTSPPSTPPTTAKRNTLPDVNFDKPLPPAPAPQPRPRRVNVYDDRRRHGVYEPTFGDATLQLQEQREVEARPRRHKRIPPPTFEGDVCVPAHVVSAARRQ